MNSMYLLLDILVLGAGAYILYAYFLMTKKGEIKENILMPKEVTMSQCKDKEGYVKYVAPKLLMFGIGAVICGVLGFINDYGQALGNWYMGVTVLFLVLLIWFAIGTRKAIKMFW